MEVCEIVRLKQEIKMSKSIRSKLEGRVDQLWEIREKLEKPRGLIRKRCPECNTKLGNLLKRNPRDAFGFFCLSGGLERKLYSRTCGYEYGNIIPMPGHCGY